MNYATKNFLTTFLFTVLIVSISFVFGMTAVKCPKCPEPPPWPIAQEATKGEIWWNPDEETMYVYKGWVKMVEEEEKYDD